MYRGPIARRSRPRGSVTPALPRPRAIVARAIANRHTRARGPVIPTAHANLRHRHRSSRPWAMHRANHPTTQWHITHHSSRRSHCSPRSHHSAATS
ncbi:hypothetical protein J2S68_002451 [Glycomyces algeriensis]|nr:hypothetical protein [Glycomyces algeriensis]